MATFWERLQDTLKAARSVWTRNPFFRASAAGYESVDLTDEQVERIKRYDLTWKWYQGQMDKPLKVRPGKPDDNVTINHCKRAVDKGVSFLFGKELTFQIDQTRQTKQEDALEAFWRDNRQGSLLHDLGLNGGVCGTFYLQLLAPHKGSARRTPRLVNLSPLAVHPEWDSSDVDKAVSYQLRWLQEGKTCREIYSLDENDRDWFVFTERLVGGRWETTRDKARWPWPWSPVIHGKNLPNPNEFFGLSDLEHDALSLAASINFVASNINRIQRLFAHPIPWGYGFAQKDLSVEPGKAILAGTEKAALQYLQMASDPSAQGFLQFLVQSFYEIVRVPEMNPNEVQMGAQSGFALRILYSDLLEKTQTKRRLYGEVLVEVCRRALEIMGHGRDRAVSIDWQEPLPILEAEQATALGFDLGAGIISKETVASRRGYDYRVEQEKIKAEREEAARQEMNLGALALANYEQGKTGGLLPIAGGAQGLPGALGEPQAPAPGMLGGKAQ